MKEGWITNNQCLSFLGICCVTHTSLHHSWKVGASVDQTQTFAMLMQKLRKILFFIFRCNLF